MIFRLLTYLNIIENAQLMIRDVKHPTCMKCFRDYRALMVLYVIEIKYYRDFFCKNNESFIFNNSPDVCPVAVRIFVSYIFWYSSHVNAETEGTEFVIS